MEDLGTVFQQQNAIVNKIQILAGQNNKDLFLAH